jgi:hypothetical protein
VSPRFDDLVDGGDLPPDELLRLRGVHEMLVAAGPPPDLPPALAEAPRPGQAEVVQIAARPRSRRTVFALIAAALAIGCFGGGYLLGDRSGNSEVVRVVPLEGVGAQSARASVSLGAAERGGNWPMELEVTGLPPSGDHEYYELFVWRHGKPSYPCVGFKAHAGTTTVRFNVPYELDEETKLVVTAIARDKSPWPGQVVMKTA